VSVQVASVAQSQSQAPLSRYPSTLLPLG
jgi:hypothetical protein